MSDETTTEQLAEIEEQAATEYTPPEGWRSLAVSEVLRAGDMLVQESGERVPTKRVGETVVDGRYIRLIKPQPVPEPEPEHSGFEGKILCEQTQPQPVPQPVQVREGRWRTRHGAIRNVTPTPAHDSRAERWPWRDAKYDQTWREDGGCHIIGESPSDLVEYLGPIEPETQPEPQAADTPATEYTPPEGWRVLAVGEVLRDGDKVVNLSNGKERPTIRSGRCVENNQSYIRLIKSEPQAATIEELRCEVSYVQRLLGESRQRVTQLEELVVSLRTINDAQEKSVRLAGQENTDLQHRLNVVSAELVEQFETVRKLRIELDAAQQVPQAVSDRFEEGWDAGTARAVETIAEWTEPFRTCGSERLAWMVMQNLPHIMRTLTGLTPED